MLYDILRREDVSKLLIEVVNNNRYNQKDEIGSIDYQKFNNTEQTLFITIDALYKYMVIIDDIKLLDDFVYQLNLLIRKIDNFHDIKTGINKLITKFCVLKLGYKDKEDKKRKEIISYIYDKYITNGYLYHAINDVYKGDIKNNGLIPQEYNNLYNEFIEIKNILGSDIISKEFFSKTIYFTDSFMMAYYYAVNSPMYFYELLCNNSIIKDKDSYIKNDYEECNKNINKIINKLELNTNNSNKVKKVFNDEWNLINKSKSCPTIIRVKRNLLLKDNKELDTTINNKELELSEVVERVLSSRYDEIECSSKIESKDIEFIELPNYNDLLIKKEEKTDAELENNETTEYNNELGKVSILILLGSIFIAIGVIITMIMVVSGG
ncbi:MAG: hypothetical protein IJF92_03615 [Bacilli bacterium]|nr:hypothetical protein [Bacilli bacterium]